MADLINPTFADGSGQSQASRDGEQGFIAEVAWISGQGDLVRLRRFPPTAAGLHPEDRGGDALVALRRGLAKQELGDLGIRLGGAEVQFTAIMLPDGLGVDGDHAGGLELRNRFRREGLDLASPAVVGRSAWQPSET